MLLTILPKAFPNKDIWNLLLRSLFLVLLLLINNTKLICLCERVCCSNTMHFPQLTYFSVLLTYNSSHISYFAHLYLLVYTHMFCHVANVSYTYRFTFIVLLLIAHRHIIFVLLCINIYLFIILI